MAAALATLLVTPAAGAGEGPLTPLAGFMDPDNSYHCVLETVPETQPDGAPDLAPVAAPAVPAGTLYRLVDLTGTFGLGRATAPGRVADDKCEPIGPVADVPVDVGAWPRPFAMIPGDWKPEPAILKEQSPDQRVYRAAMQEWLMGRGLEGPAPELDQVVRTDLDGDGVEEVVVVANRADWTMEVDARPGDFSAVLVRRIVEGVVRTEVVTASVHTQAGQGQLTFVNRLAAIVDADGDGRMELLVTGGYYEGRYAELYRFDGEAWRMTRSCGCGA